MDEPLGPFALQEHREPPLIVFPFDFVRLPAWLCSGMDTPIGPHALCSLASQASPSVQSEIPSKARSLMRNCPGTADRAGKPPRLGSQTPGVVTRKLRVVRNIPAAKALPRAETRGENGRTAMSSATVTSTTPSTAEKPRTLMSPYTQLIRGLLATNGRIPSAS